MNEKNWPGKETWKWLGWKSSLPRVEILLISHMNPEPEFKIPLKPVAPRHLNWSWEEDPLVPTVAQPAVSIWRLQWDGNSQQKCTGGAVTFVSKQADEHLFSYWVISPARGTDWQGHCLVCFTVRLLIAWDWKRNLFAQRLLWFAQLSYLGSVLFSCYLHLYLWQHYHVNSWKRQNFWNLT